MPSEFPKLAVQLAPDWPVFKVQHCVWILFSVFHAPEMVVLGDNLVQGKDDPFDIVPLGKAFGLADVSSTVKVKEKEIICLGIDEEIPRGCVLVDESELEI